MKSLIPMPVVEFTPPARPEDMTVRLHNQFAKQALRETLAEHWRKHTRRHFQFGARQRYGYFTRSPGYRRRKLKVKGHDIDLVYSGKSRAVISGQSPQIRTSGAAEGGKKNLGGYYKLRFPFTGGSGRQRRRGSNDTVARMVRELERWAGDEVAWARAEFLRRYMEKVNNWRGRRRRRRMPKH